jgi:hypothetical protein
MRILAEVSTSNVDKLAAAAPTAGAVVPVGWSEPFDDFCLFLEDCGIAVDGLPAWAPATAVMVVTRGTRIWIKTANRAERRRNKRLAAKGKNYLTLTDMSTPPWVRLSVTGVDPTKMDARRRCVARGRQ